MALCILILRDNPTPEAKKAVDFEWHSCPMMPPDSEIKRGSPAQVVARALIGMVHANAQGPPVSATDAEVEAHAIEPEDFDGHLRAD